MLSTSPGLTQADLTLASLTLPNLTLPDLTLSDMTLPGLTLPSLKTISPGAEHQTLARLFTTCPETIWPGHVDKSYLAANFWPETKMLTVLGSILPILTLPSLKLPGLRQPVLTLTSVTLCTDTWVGTTCLCLTCNPRFKTDLNYI